MKPITLAIFSLLIFVPFLTAQAADVAQLRQQLEATKKPYKAYLLWRSYGDALKASGDLAGAIEAYKNAVKLRPKDVLNRLVLAAAYEQVELFDEAMAEYQASLVYDPKSYTSLARLAALYLRKGYNSKAMECYIKSLTLRPDTDIYRQTAKCAENMGNLKLAVSMLRQVLSKESLYDDNYNTGRILTLLGEHSEAEKYLSEAVRLNPRMPDAYLLLGLLYEKMDNYALAEKMLLIAQEKAPDEGIIYFFLAQLYHHQGARAKALEEIAKASKHAKTQMLSDYSAKFQQMLTEDKRAKP
jgi:tetratricopeptide (TPR) repeat protein